jgi:malic enzyme
VPCRDLRHGTCARPAPATARASLSGVLQAEWIRDTATDPVVFVLANPDPEVVPAEAAKHAAVVASSRSDYPYQVSNVLAFPGVFRGLLDARATDVTTDQLLSVAGAIAHVVTNEELRTRSTVTAAASDLRHRPQLPR